LNLHLPGNKTAVAGVISSNPNRGWLANLGLTLPFLALYWADLAHHTLFFDELNAWGISAASSTLPRLFYLVHYEGHPWLWYFLLWLPSRFTHDPRAMLWVVAPVGTAIYLIIGLLSPFTQLQKVLIFLSYFVAFEYTVMNRMYGIMFLLALLYVSRRMRDPEAVVGNVALLGVMANTDMSGVLLSMALLLEYIYDRHQANKIGSGNQPKRIVLVALAIYAAMLLLSIATLLPSPDISWSSSGRLGSYAVNPRFWIRVATNMIAAPWWPISKDFPRRFWETDAQAQRLLLVLVPLVLIAYWRVLRGDRKLLLMMGTTLTLGTLFAAIVYVGRVRHWGIAFITFLLCLWIQNSVRERQGKERPHSWVVPAYALMTLSALSGILAVASSWTHPFSQARATAAWIRQNEPKGVLVVGAPDVSFASVAEEMQRPVYFLECYCTDTFKLFSRHREDFPDEKLGDRLSTAMGRLNVSSLVFVFWRPLSPEDTKMLQAHSLSASLIREFTGADTFFENHYIYQIVRVYPSAEKRSVPAIRYYSAPVSDVYPAKYAARIPVP
jgi:hypothetical protein